MKRIVTLLCIFVCCAAVAWAGNPSFFGVFSSQSKKTKTMTGYYSYFADAGSFHDCRTGKTYPVAMKGDNARLESEYGKVRNEPNEKVFVKLEGYLSREPKMEGKGTVQSIVPTKLLEFDRNGSCPAGSALATSAAQGGSVENIEWTLVELNGKAEIEAMKTPQIRLDSKEKRAAGVAGCNRFFGAYKLDGGNLSFSQMGATRMMCPTGMDIERDFLKALELAKTFKLNGGKLELYDGDVKVAVFTTK